MTVEGGDGEVFILETPTGGMVDRRELKVCVLMERLFVSTKTLVKSRKKSR